MTISSSIIPGMETDFDNGTIRLSGVTYDAQTLYLAVANSWKGVSHTQRVKEGLETASCQLESNGGTVLEMVGGGLFEEEDAE